jgi:hypothetical protein
MSNTLQRLKEESLDIPEPCPYIDETLYHLEILQEGDPGASFSVMNGNLQTVREICEMLIRSNQALYEYAKEKEQDETIPSETTG